MPWNDSPPSRSICRRRSGPSQSSRIPRTKPSKYRLAFQIPSLSTFIYMCVCCILLRIANNKAAAAASRGEERAGEHGEIVQRQPNAERAAYRRYPRSSCRREGKADGEHHATAAAVFGTIGKIGYATTVCSISFPCIRIPNQLSLSISKRRRVRPCSKKRPCRKRTLEHTPPMWKS